MLRPIMTAAELAEHHAVRSGRDYSRSCDSEEDMELAERQGWHAVSAWGQDGWMLGDWPYVTVYTRNVWTAGARFELRTICEGDSDVYVFASGEDRDAALDYLFLWHAVRFEYPELIEAGIHQAYDSDEGEMSYDARPLLDAGTLEVPVRFRGPYGRRRRYTPYATAHQEA